MRAYIVARCFAQAKKTVLSMVFERTAEWDNCAFQNPFRKTLITVAVSTSGQFRANCRQLNRRNCRRVITTARIVFIRKNVYCVRPRVVRRLKADLVCITNAKGKKLNTSAMEILVFQRIIILILYPRFYLNAYVLVP